MPYWPYSNKEGILVLAKLTNSTDIHVHFPKNHNNALQIHTATSQKRNCGIYASRQRINPCLARLYLRYNNKEASLDIGMLKNTIDIHA